MGDLWILPKHQRIKSPNIWQGRAGVQIDTLVLHYAVDGDNFERGENEHARFEALTPSHDATDVAKLFARKSRGASAHFVIGRDGSLAQCVALDDTAWHAGSGALPYEGVGRLERPRSQLMNRRSIGIELCNAGWAADRIGVPKEHIREAIHPANARRRKVQRWEVFRDAQYEVLDELLAMIRPHFVADREVFVVGHEDVVNRDTTGGEGGKVDPGPLFDWTRNSWSRFGYFPLRYDFAKQRWCGRDVRKLEKKETEG